MFNGKDDITAIKAALEAFACIILLGLMILSCIVMTLAHHAR